jgi:ferrous iron transport protein A
MPLMEAATGEEVRLAEIRGGRGLSHRLAELGLTPGTRMRIVANNHAGPLIVSVKESRLMLGRGMIDRIFVTPA